MCRHPRLRLCKPQVTSTTRVKGVTKANVATFFNIFEPVLRLIKFSPHRSFIYEETSLTAFQHEVCKFIYLKCKQRVPLSSAERGSLVTTAKFMNATITCVSPLLVFSRSNMKADLLDSAPPGPIAASHKAGWIQERCFTQRFKYFVRFVKLSRKDPIILTLGGHYWSLFSFEEYRDDRLCSGKRSAHCLPSPA